MLRHQSVRTPAGRRGISDGEINCVLYPISYIIYPISCILYPISRILYPISYILYPISYILYLLYLSISFIFTLIPRVIPFAVFLVFILVQPLFFSFYLTSFLWIRCSFSPNISHSKYPLLIFQTFFIYPFLRLIVHFLTFPTSLSPHTSSCSC